MELEFDIKRVWGNSRRFRVGFNHVEMLKDEKHNEKSIKCINFGKNSV